MKGTLWNAFAICLVSIAVVGTISCRMSVRPVYIDAEERAASQAIDIFHQRLSDEQFDAIYGEAHEVFRKLGGRQQLRNAMKKTHSGYGRFRQVYDSTFNVMPGNPLIIRVLCYSGFEKRDAIEQFVFLSEGRGPRLASYAVNPSGTTNEVSRLGFGVSPYRAVKSP